MMNQSLQSGTRFIWENARLLERAIFEGNFFNGEPERIIEILRNYQNDDGGFGNALEPDLRCPESQPLFVEFGLRTMYDCNLHDPDLAMKACEFLSKHASLEKGTPLIFPSFRRYPHATHMDGPYSEQPSMERLTSLVGLLAWQGINHPWLDQAVERCIEYITNVRFTDVHTILNAFCLVESLAGRQPVEQLFDKLSNDLFSSSYFCINVPVTTYCLTPLNFTPTPNAYCRRIFTDIQIEAHLDEMEKQQEEDGGWPIRWEPPGEMARREWRAYKTVAALSTLRAYGRL
jgi:hypothetical protein